MTQEAATFKKKAELSLPQHKEIILKWVKSCWSSEQLDLLGNIIAEFISNRFRDHIEKKVKAADRQNAVRELHMTEHDLGVAIVDQRVIVAGQKKRVRMLSAINQLS